MIGASLAAGLLLIVAWTAAALRASRALGRRSNEAEGSRVIHLALWVGVFGAVAAATAATHGVVSAGLVAVGSVLLFVRAAVDARGDRLRQQVAFVSIYAGHFGLTWLYLWQQDRLDGSGISDVTAFALHDVLSRLMVAPAELWGLSTAETAATPIVTAVVDDFVVVLSVVCYAIAVVGLRALAFRRVVRFGADVLPASRWLAAALLVLAIIDGLSDLGMSRIAVALLVPFFSFELAWLVWSAAGSLATRPLIVALAGAFALLPGCAIPMGIIGAFLHLARVDLFVPVLFATEEPRRLAARTPGAWGLAAAAVLGMLAVADAATLSRASPLVGAPPEACARTAMRREGDSVRVESPWLSFEIDARETAIREDAGRTCQALGKRICTSDEWYLACLCTYPSESMGGLQLSPNTLLAHRLERDRTEAALGGDARGRVEPGGLHFGLSEIVSASRTDAQPIVAGANERAPDGWMADCRYRARPAASVLRDQSWPFIGTRCCR